MPLTDPLPISPFTRPARGEVVLPGSKSLTNRALILAALCQRPVTLTGALFSEDTHLMIEALSKLGFTVDADPEARTVRVAGQGSAFNRAEIDLFVGLAGTAARFLTALCAAAPAGVYRIDGVPQMRKRPMRPLLDALRALGADIRCTGEEGFFPIEIRAAGLGGGPVSIDARESSQLLSALLMVAPLARAPVKVKLEGGVRWPFVRMTTKLMQQFGQPPIEESTSEKNAFSMANTSRYAFPGATYAIEADASAASYFLALPLVTGGRLAFPNLLGGLQGDARFVEVLCDAGLHSETTTGNRTFGAPADGTRRAVTQDFSEFSDTFLTLAAIAPLLDGPTRISGIAHTRKQETDRVAGMARELKKLGQDVLEEEGALTITPRPLRAGQTIETYGDHRFAMSFGILGCHDLHGDGRPWLSIKDPACCAKTFPHFFELLESLRQKTFTT
ncbi:MAG TPA: 3-phosphoshikimate 1-carboxyvinyltransferase [Opitutaceae bacterium]|nr:3-phosphoshikimate 1-carboxyvinyltransferase [Opitutaceae bacterium]